MKLSEMIKVMQLYANGGVVEYKSRKDAETRWTPVTSPAWDWAYYDYRIKEQIQKVTIEKWLCRDKDGNFMIIEISPIDKFEYCEKVKLLESYEIEL